MGNDNRQQQQDPGRQFDSSGQDDRMDNLDTNRGAGESQGGGGFGAQQQQDDRDIGRDQNANFSEEGDRNSVNRGNDQSR